LSGGGGSLIAHSAERTEADGIANVIKIRKSKKEEVSMGRGGGPA
jgi:hypothetical protein